MMQFNYKVVNFHYCFILGVGREICRYSFIILRNHDIAKFQNPWNIPIIFKQTIYIELKSIILQTTHLGLVRETSPHVLQDSITPWIFVLHVQILHSFLCPFPHIYSLRITALYILSESLHYINIPTFRDPS